MSHAHAPLPSEPTPDWGSRVEQSLERAIARATASDTCPPTLAAALRYAVFPGGARLRPSLALSTALACGVTDLDLAVGGAVALELLHTASLVHDDMPCFDNAATRRGLPSVHRQFGESVALLVGDGLIVQAFESLCSVETSATQAQMSMLRALTAAAGTSRGLVAGQGWEVENNVSIETYHRAKTASLFEAACELGALAANGSPERFRRFGRLVGFLYQAADDWNDAQGDAEKMGKPVGNDAACGRPNLIGSLGAEGLRIHVAYLAQQASEALPHGSGPLRNWLTSLLAKVSLEEVS